VKSATGRAIPEWSIIIDRDAVMVTVVHSTQAPNPEIRKLEQQIKTLQGRLNDAMMEQSETSQHKDPATAGGKSARNSERDMQRHDHLRKNILPYLGEYGPLVVLTAPIIYGTIFPLLILDLSLTLYQYVCFPVYGIKRVKRGDFIVIDRHLLGYLNAVEKFNCVFCGYANGLLAYSQEIASQTETFWCPIRHAALSTGLHPRTKEYAQHMDGTEYRVKQKLSGARARKAACGLRACHGCKPQD